MKRMFCMIAALALSVSFTGCEDRQQPVTQSQSATQTSQDTTLIPQETTQMPQTQEPSEEVTLPNRVYLLAKEEKSGTPLSEQELQAIQETYFSLDAEASQEILYELCTDHADAPFEAPIQYWYQTALISFYSAPENVNLQAMFYDGVGDKIEEAEYGSITTVPGEKMDDILQQVFGIGLERINLLHIFGEYDQENDCYYLYKSDAYGAPVITLQSGIRCDDGSLVIDYKAENREQRRMTLVPDGDTYRIASNLHLSYDERAPFYEENVLQTDGGSYTLPLLVNLNPSFGYYGSIAGQYMYEQTQRYLGYMQAQVEEQYVPKSADFSAYRFQETLSVVINDHYADRTDYHVFVVDLTCMEIATTKELIDRCDVSDAVLSACVTAYLQDNGLQACAYEAQAQIDLQSYGVFFNENGQLHIVLRLTNPDESYQDHIIAIHNIS